MLKFFGQLKSMSLPAMPKARSVFIYCVLFLLLSTWLVAEQDSLPDPWALKRDWWKSLAEPSDPGPEARWKAFLKILNDFSKSVPDSEQELASTALKKISESAQHFLALRESKGWLVEQAPTLKASYSIEELLEIAEQVKLDGIDLAAAQAREDRLAAVIKDALGREDQLYQEYTETTPQSLQRVLTSLSFMAAVSSRAVLEEKLRLAREKKKGVETRSQWYNTILTEAPERLSPKSLDPKVIDQSIVEASKRVQHFTRELLQIEAELVPNGQSERIRDHSLGALVKLVSYTKDQVRIIIGHAKKNIIRLDEEKASHRDARTVVNTAKRWLLEVDNLQGRVRDWRDYVHRERDEAQRLLPLGETLDQKLYSEYVAFQREAQGAVSELDALELELFQAKVLARFVLKEATERLHWFRGLWQRTYLALESLGLGVSQRLLYPIFRINEQPVSLFSFGKALIILLLAYGCSKLFQHTLSEFSRSKQHISNASVYTLNRVFHYAFLSVGFVWALSSIGIDFSNLLIIAGALSVGIGFGLQGIVNNFLGGLIVLFDRKLRVGDLIELAGGQMGTISEVNVQNTLIRTLSGQDVLIPNSQMISQQLSNWTLRDHFVRLHLPFGVSYDSDKERVAEVVEKAALNLEETLTDHRKYPGPKVWLVRFGSSSLDFELVVWVDLRRSKQRKCSLKAAYNWEIETALKEACIEIPFPQCDVHLKSNMSGAAES